VITISARSAFLLAAAAGAAGWLAISLASGRREAWDSQWYFGIFLPGIAILVTWLGFLSPRGAWRWAFVPFAAQALIAFIQNPTGGLHGLIVFAILGIVCLVPALVGAWFRRWYDRQGASA
jgi:hypothetical protein